MIARMCARFLVRGFKFRNGSRAKVSGVIMKCAMLGSGDRWGVAAAKGGEETREEEGRKGWRLAGLLFGIDL